MAMPQISQAEVVASEGDIQRTRELIREATRAEMEAHSVASGSGDEDASSEVEEDAAALGPYERRLQRLKEATTRHQTIDREDTPAFAQSCMELGELNYQLGHMEDSQEHYVSALEELLGLGDGGSQDNEVQMMIAKSMNTLGAIHARCGDFDEASRWYEESLKRTQKMIEGESDAKETYHYELGKTQNGMAALLVMRGGDVQWDEAMALFREAERNYLHGFDQVGQDGDERNALEVDPASSIVVTKDDMQRMSRANVESLINVRSNMGELLRQRGQHDAAVKAIQLALDMARMALENEYDNADIDAVEHPTEGPSPDEQRNAIVDLQTKIADTLISAKKYDDAAESYEHALSSHIHFRQWGKDDGREKHPSAKQTTVLPATATAPNILLDLPSATTIEAAIRNNLAHALAQIGQDKLSLGQYEASLSITRKIGGDFNMEVGHTLMGMGALLGGPMRDFSKALNCFKEALFVYQRNLEELSDGSQENEEDGSSSLRGYYTGEDGEEIERHITNASKNINLIEAALMRDREDNASKRRRS
ncbi:hypothetical protein ACHAXT_004649 [Thalassiosira profunda]